MRWREKRICLSLFGTYEFLNKGFGLFSTQAIHPCLYCTLSKGEIHTPPAFSEGNITPRWKEKTTTNVKFFNNVIRRPILDIELEQVVLPYLHILL